MEASSDQTAKDQNQNRPRMLNFNAPLLSIRRAQGSSPPTSLELFSCPSLRGQAMINASDRIPFSWEESPGKPKDMDSSETIHEEDITPRPKLPPNWWHRTSAATAEQTINENDDHDGFDGDVDVSFDADFCGDIDDDIFSDAIDVFSLSEAIDIVEKSEKAKKSDGLRLKLEECRNGGDDQYPDFIIQRFLPDATALAAASALSSASTSLKKTYSYNFSRNISSSSELPRRPDTQSYSPKACGLETLFPWRVKHRLCGARRDSVSTIQLRRSDQKHKKR